jgi:hypothetical protein
METLSLKEIIKSDYRPTTVAERLRWIVHRKRESDEEIIPSVLGLELEKRRALECLMSGRPIKLVGPYGCGKTTFAKGIFSLLKEYHRYKEIFSPEGCPVQEDALNLAYSAKVLKDPKLKGACPVCRKLYLNPGNKTGDIPIARFEPREAKGYARVPPDATPEDLVGTYNLKKLVEIGDPLDPEVFKHGKIGMASGGLLFVNEIGKLPDRSQYTLLEASVEGTIIPGKCRETFPVDFLLIADTNPDDEIEIDGAINDRLATIAIFNPEREDELKIVRKEGNYSNVYIPKMFFDIAIDVVRETRKNGEFPNIGIRGSIDAVRIAKVSADWDGRKVVGLCDLKEGICAAILGRVRYEEWKDKELEVFRLIDRELREFDRKMRDICVKEDSYLPSYEELAREINKFKLAGGFDPSKFKGIWKKYPYVRNITREVMKSEKPSKDLLAETVIRYLQALRRRMKNCEGELEEVIEE